MGSRTRMGRRRLVTKGWKTQMEPWRGHSVEGPVTSVREEIRIRVAYQHQDVSPVKVHSDSRFKIFKWARKVVREPRQVQSGSMRDKVW